MGVFAIHDEEGNISGIVSSPADGPRVSVSLEPGHSMTELDAADIAIDSTDPQGTKERVAALIENQRVQVGSTPRGTLVSRQYRGPNPTG